MLHKLRFVIAGLVIILINQAVSFAVSASVPDSFRPSGSTRYAVASASDTVPTSSLTFVNIPNLSQSITIPSGKQGDVFVSFCSQLNVNLPSVFVYARALVGSSQASPGSMTLDGATYPSTQTRCATFYKLNVAEGTKTVRMQWAISNAAAAVFAYQRSMLVTVNIHN